MATGIPEGWRRVLDPETRQPYYQRLQRFVDSERARHDVFPPPRVVFQALRLVPYRRVRVVILGQDPYPSPRHAHGLAFSVMPGVPPPPSLANIFRELRHDLDLPAPHAGSLVPWARQGVLLLNTVLTVRAHHPGSHRGHGWERFTSAIITTLSAARRPVVFVLWGRDAQRKMAMIDRRRHTVICGTHPSPLSAARGFFGSRPFSRVNAALLATGGQEIDWRLGDRYGDPMIRERVEGSRR